MKIRERQGSKIVQRSFKLRVALSRKSDDDVAAQSRFRQALAHPLKQVAVVSSVVVAPHLFEDIVVARLGADVQMRADDLGARDQIEQTIRHLARVEGAQA